ncbi:hypothetical protein L195_g040601, partial [Trifolium pratense]
ARNDTLFGNGFKEAEQVVEDIKRLSWRWSLARLKMSPCLLYAWCVEPFVCLGRVVSGSGLASFSCCSFWLDCSPSVFRIGVSLSCLGYVPFLSLCTSYA